MDGCCCEPLNALRKTLKKLRMINNQYKSKHESKKASVAVYKQKLQPDGRKSLEASPGLTYKNSNVPRKIEFSTLVGLPHQGEGSDLCT